MSGETRAYCLFLLLQSCQPQVKFDQQGWKEREDIWYPNREQMSSDLIENYHLKGRSIDNAIKLLGEPDGRNNNAIFYKVTEEYGSGIDPKKGKNLVLSYTQDSTVTDIKLEKWGK